MTMVCTSRKNVKRTSGQWSLGWQVQCAFTLCQVSGVKHNRILLQY